MAYRTLVDIETLAQHGDDPKWVVIDCRSAIPGGPDPDLGRKLYAESHIPGAFFADVESDLAGEKSGMNGRHPLPDPEAFAAYLRGCGVSNDTQIVAYDGGGDMFAARLWVLGRWIGHEAVAVLNGGFYAWQNAGQPVTSASSFTKGLGNLQVRLHPDLIVDADYVHSQLDAGSMQLVDARAADRFAGQNETIDPVAGHIPGARNRWFKENYGTDLRFRTADELRRRFESIGPSERVVHQCGSGVSAAANMLAMEIAGMRGSRLYAGSWSEWIADPKRPTTSGPQ